MMPVPDPHPDVFDVEWPLRVADVDREGRLKFDAATRHIQDIGSDQLREMGFEETHPLWIVRRTMIDLIEPIEFKDMLRLRRWCSGTSNRWCEMRVRIDGRKRRAHRIRGVLDQHQPRDAGARAHLRRLHRRAAAHHDRRPAAVEGLPEARAAATTADDIRDISGPRQRHRHLRPHEQLGVLERRRGLSRTASPSCSPAPLRVTIEHDLPVALGETSWRSSATCYPPGRPTRSANTSSIALLQRSHMSVGDEVKAVASIFAL